MKIETIKNGKKIAEFLGYKLARCNNGLAWESPYGKHIDDKLKLHGRLYYPEGSSYFVSGNDCLNFKSSYDKLFILIEELEKRHCIIQLSINNDATEKINHYCFIMNWCDVTKSASNTDSDKEQAILGAIEKYISRF